MTLEEIATLLRAIANRGGPFGSESEKSLRNLADILSLRPDDDLLQLRKVVTPKPKTAGRKTKAPKSPKSIDRAIVTSYLNALAQAENISTAETVLDRIAGDKGVKAPELYAIATDFTGIEKFAKRQLAIDAMRKRIRREHWDQGALEEIKSRGLR